MSQSPSGKQRRKGHARSRIEQFTQFISGHVGLDKDSLFRVLVRDRAVALHRTVLAVFVLFGNLRGREARDRRITRQDIEAVDLFIREAGGRRSFGFESDASLLQFRDGLLEVRRLVSSTGLTVAQRGRLAAKLVGPLVEKLAYLHPDFQKELKALALNHVDAVNHHIGSGGRIYDGTGTLIYDRAAGHGTPPPRLNPQLSFLATHVKLVTPEGEKDFTDFLVVSYAGPTAGFKLRDNLRQAISVSNENKAPSVISESNYQHADAAARLAGASEIIYTVRGKRLRAKPEDFIYSPAAVNEVTVSIKGRFGGSTRTYASADPADWAHSLKYFVPAGDASAQLRVVISLRAAALKRLLE